MVSSMDPSCSAFALTVRSEQFVFLIFLISCFTGRLCLSPFSSLVLPAKHSSGLWDQQGGPQPTKAFEHYDVVFLDQLFHNSCNERVNCCLIYVKSDGGLHLFIGQSSISPCGPRSNSYPVMNHSNSFNFQ